jgi:catechol 2,3-dioxygenase-like lactoylglutathione lyase family enzyme
MEGVVIDHIDFPVSDYARSKAFYEQALAAVRWSAKCSRI